MTAADAMPVSDLLLDAMPQPAMLVGLVGSARPVLHANRALHEFSGHDAAFWRARDAFFLATRLREPIAVQELREAIAASTDNVCNCLFDAAAEAVPVRIIIKRVDDQHLLVCIEDQTRIVRLRESLRTSEARLQVAMDGSTLSMWEWNVERDEVYYNEHWQRVLGIDPAALIGRKELADRLLLPADRADVMEKFQRHLQGTIDGFQAEYSLTLPSGKTGWFSTYANVVRRDARGNPLRVIGTLQDISSRRSHSDRAIEVQERWERAVRGTSDGLYDWNLHTGQVWYAQRFREIIGYDNADFPDTFNAFQQVLHPEDRALVLFKVRRHLEDRASLDVRCRVVTRQGATLWCRLRGQAVRDAAGRPVRLSGSLSDIHAQIDAEIALGRSQNFYGTILDSLPLYVAYVDRDQKVMYANGPFQQFFGRPLATSRGDEVRDVIGEIRYEGIEAYFREALQGRTVESNGKLCSASGQILDIEGVFVPHADDDGQIIGCFVVARDVTEKKQLEAELRQSQKMEAIGRLTGGIAHDFNNLLAVIVGNMQLLTRAVREQPRLVRQAETSMKAAMRGADLTRRLLAFARQQVLEPRVVELDALIGGMYELLRRSLTGDIEIRQVSAPDVWPVKIDPGQLENAVLNLVINARDAMPDGGAIVLSTRNISIDKLLPDQVSVGGENTLRPGDYAVLEVLDTGAGMAPDTLKRAFEPFFTTKDVGKGSGLGLAMVYGFVRQSGGYVRLESTLGKGTTVQLFLPRAAGETRRTLPNDSAPQAEPSQGCETILVVEDNAEVRATAVDILSSLGYRVLEAANGYQALDRFMQHSDIELVFSDVMLPGGLTGTQLIEKLRERRPELKVLMTSAFSESSVLSQQILNGTLQLLTKPYRVEDLARRVRSILDEQEETDCAPA